MDFGPHQDKTSGQGQGYLNSYFYRRNARIDPAAQFNQTDRNWRARFQAAQNFSENDGKLDLYRNADYRKARYNIFRRIIKKPGDLFEFHVLSKIYPNWIKARAVRMVIPYAFGGLAIAYYFTYYGLYIANDWTTMTGWNMYQRRPAIYPGSDEWPRAQSYEKTEKWEYGFHANMDMEKDTKIKISTPLRYG